VAAQLAAARSELIGARKRPTAHALPSAGAIASAVADLRAALFPDHSGVSDLSEDGIAAFVRFTLGRAIRTLGEQIRCALWFTCEQTAENGNCRDCDRRAEELAQTFASRLPAIRAKLGSDARAAHAGDPASTSLDEIVLCYPGFTAIVHHRLAHELYLLGLPLIARMISEQAKSASGVDIHPGAQIGHSFFIDHGTGVVIGETATIGDRVRLYQGVTLGAKSFELDEHGNPRKGVPRHPSLEDDVTIYAGATILGRITIGKGSVIGGNVWVTKSLLPGSRVTQAQAKNDSYIDGGGI
jgi:serine O-acetyltransferase